MTRKNARRLSPGVFLCLLFGFATAVQAACPAPAALTWTPLQRVVDGDTLVLEDGRKLRLIAVNTPELGRDGHPDQPLARRARERAQQFFSGAAAVGWAPGPQRQDRYGRTLAQVYGQQGSLAADLLQRGLAWLVAIPPNIGDIDCLQPLEAVARSKGLGVWGEPQLQPRRAQDLSPQDGGFALVTGVIQRVVRTRGGWWLEMPGISLRVPAKHWHYFAASHPGDGPESWLQRRVEVRGWIINRRHSPAVVRDGHPPLMMTVAHPAMISLQ